jgi:DNA-binding SARP family transcriptional activator
MQIDSLEFGVLGPLALWRPDAIGTLTAPRLRSLLTLLLLQTAPMPPGRISSALDEQPHRSDGAGAVHVAVHRLRHWLRLHGEHRLELQPEGYRLTVPAGSVDARRFGDLVAAARELIEPACRAQALRSALALWRGPVAADAGGRVQQLSTAVELVRLRRQATVELGVSGLDASRPDLALPLLAQSAAAAPYDEQVGALFALCLAADGQQAEALATIEATRRTLATELGIEPGRHLRDAQLRILRQYEQYQ